MITYRKMELTDIPELAGLYMETFNAPPWKDNWTKETAGKRLRQMICVEDFYGMCAYEDGVLCGMILGCMEQYFDKLVFNVREFCIRNEKRGKGLGTALFQQFERELQALGVGELILYTLRDKSTLGFYGRQGMKEREDLALLGKNICQDAGTPLQ